MEWGVKTDIGKIRDNNEDSFYCNDKDNKIFIVADGMGGHNAGEIASKIAIETISTFINNQLDNNVEFNCDIIRKAIDEANKVIYEQSKILANCDGMGTTLTVALIINHMLYIGHIGDSRAYILDDDELIQLTQDHTLVSELVKNGSITEKEAEAHPKRNIITKALGTETKIAPDIIINEIKKNNIVILCTDGLTNAISNDEIKASFSKSSNLQETCDFLVDLANSRGGYDNITILAIRYMGS